MKFSFLLFYFIVLCFSFVRPFLFFNANGLSEFGRMAWVRRNETNSCTTMTHFGIETKQKIYVVLQIQPAAAAVGDVSNNSAAVTTGKEPHQRLEKKKEENGAINGHDKQLGGVELCFSFISNYTKDYQRLLGTY